MELSLFNGMASDYLAYLGSPVASLGGSVATLALQSVLTRRAERGREILLQQLSKAKISLAEVQPEEAAAVTFRYMRAATEGAAHNNLKLLAGVIAGQIAGPGLYADDFLRWADTLASLTYEEIVVLGVMQRLQASPPVEVKDEALAYTRWRVCVSQTTVHGIPEDTAEYSANALVRTGLVQLVPGSMEHPMLPSPTKALTVLTSLLDIEGILVDA